MVRNTLPNTCSVPCGRALTRSPHPPLSQIAAALVPRIARGRTVGAIGDGLHYHDLRLTSTPMLQTGIADETGIADQVDPVESCDLASSAKSLRSMNHAKLDALLCKIANDTPAAAAPPTLKKCSTIATCSALELCDSERKLLELAVRPWMPAKRDRSMASPPTVIPEETPATERPLDSFHDGFDSVSAVVSSVKPPETSYHDSLIPQNTYFQDLEYVRQVTELEFLRRQQLEQYEQQYWQHQWQGQLIYDPSLAVCQDPHWCRFQQHGMVSAPPLLAPLEPASAMGIDPFGLQLSLASAHSLSSVPYVPETAYETTSLSYLELAMDKEGSQLLQQRLQSMSPAELSEVVRTLAPKLRELTTHKYGNYLVSALARFPSAHRQLVSAVKGRMVKLMQHPQGCRVVQRALEHLPTSKARALVGELRGKVAQIACDKEGKYSILIALKCTREPWILNEVAESVLSLCTSRNGSLFLQRLLDPKHDLLPKPMHGPGSHTSNGTEELDHACDIGPVLDALVRLGPEQLAVLAMDEYANFVVKLGMLHDATHREALVCALLPQLEALSVTKWGSHVAKAVVCVASPSQLAEARASLMAMPLLRSHAYASFVMVALERTCTTKGVA